MSSIVGHCVYERRSPGARGLYGVPGIQPMITEFLPGSAASRTYQNLSAGRSRGCVCTHERGHNREAPVLPGAQAHIRSRPSDSREVEAACRRAAHLSVCNRLLQRRVAMPPDHVEVVSLTSTNRLRGGKLLQDISGVFGADPFLTLDGRSGATLRQQLRDALGSKLNKYSNEYR